MYCTILNVIYLVTSLHKDIRAIMSLLDDLKAAQAVVSDKLDQLALDVAARLEANKAALAEAQANAVSQAEVDAAVALGAKVDSIEGLLS